MESIRPFTRPYNPNVNKLNARAFIYFWFYVAAGI